MKLLSFSTPGGARAGVLVDDSVYDAAALLGVEHPVRDVADLIAIDRVLERLNDGLARALQPRALADLQLLAPLIRPPTIRDHIAFEEHATRQFSRPVAEVWARRPIHYYSNPSRLIGSGAPVPRPATERLDYELEIAAVIGRESADVVEAGALDAIFGFTIFNDWSARDLQADEMAYGLGPAKGKDFASSLGPWVVTIDELAPKLVNGTLDLRCQVRVNGMTWADSNSRAQYHSWGAIIEHAAQDSVLLPGDLIASGTVGGCSIAEAIRKGLPARYLVPGDQVELEVEGLGVLANTIAENSRSHRQRYWAKDLPPMPEPLPGYGSTPSTSTDAI